MTNPPSTLTRDLLDTRCGTGSPSTDTGDENVDGLIVGPLVAISIYSRTTIGEGWGCNWGGLGLHLGRVGAALGTWGGLGLQLGGVGASIGDPFGGGNQCCRLENKPPEAHSLNPLWDVVFGCFWILWAVDTHCCCCLVMVRCQFIDPLALETSWGERNSMENWLRVLVHPSLALLRRRARPQVQEALDRHQTGSLACDR